MANILRPLLTASVCLFVLSCAAQDTLAIHKDKCPTRYLIGRWQLIKSFSKGAYHQVAKKDFDDIMELKGMHRYREEVYYESNHWVLEGKWTFDPKTRILSLFERKYTLGKLEEHPRDIFLTLIVLNKKDWAGSSSEKGQRQEVFYNRIP